MEWSNRAHHLTVTSCDVIDKKNSQWNNVDKAMPEVCLIGKLSEISTVDLFQLINFSQKTGRFDMILEHGRASVVFREGEIVHARYSNLRNKEAVHELIGIKSGRFIYTKGIPKEFENAQPVGRLMHMLLEGLHRLDERDA